MTASRDPEHLIHAFLLEGEEQLQDQIFDAVRAEIETKRQRTFLGPWRTPTMNKFVTYGLAAVAAVAVVFFGAQIFGSPTGGVGTDATPTPTSSPTATVRPTPSATPAPPLTQSFTSTQHGISMSYPEGWKAEPATKPWTDRTFPVNFLGTKQVDFLYDPTLRDHLFLDFASQSIGDATPGEWVARQMASGEGCSETEPISVDAATGLIGTGECNVAVVTKSGRGYWIQLLTSGDEAWLGSTFDRAWFEQVLATVKLHPSDAVD